MLAAVQVTDAGQPVRVKLSVVDGFPKDAVEQWAGQNLERRSVVHTDGLGCFRGVEAAGCEHKPPGPGHAHVRGRIPFEGPFTALILNRQAFERLVVAVGRRECPGL